MANIIDVARQAGVSPSTVSRVLSGNAVVAPATKEKVLAAVRALGYQPNALAQGLKSGSIKTIGLVIPNVRNLVFPAAIRGIEDTAMQHGYAVVLCNTDEDPAKERFYVDGLRRRLVDGFIFSTARPGHEQYLALHREGFPVVSLIRNQGSEVDAVVLDNFAGGYLGTQYLLSRGLRRIAIINGNLEVLLYRQRFDGFRQALAEAGLAVDEKMVAYNADDWADGYKAMRAMLQHGCRPEAVFATSDPKAIGAMRAIKEAGLAIPGDISVLGFDDCDLAPLLDPPLTTVAQPFYDMGVKAATRLINIIEAPCRPQPRVEVLPARLVVRQSVI